MSEKDKPKRQVNVRLHEERFRMFKAKCALDGKTVSSVVEDLIDMYIAGRVTLPQRGQLSIPGL